SGAGTESALTRLGGLVGLNGGTIRDSFASANVVAQNFTISGGLVGNNHALIERSYATGVLSGLSSNYLGRLLRIHSLHANVTSSNAAVVVTGTSFNVAGGAFGSNVGTVGQTYATGEVRVGANGVAGGFVGANAATVSQSFSTGAVTGGANSAVGGFAGGN